MKRFVALLLSLVCAFALFSCGNGGGDNPGGGDSAAPTVAEQIAPFTAAINATNPKSAVINVTYVTEEKTSISGAFTGDKVLGTVIFTSSTFPKYAEREYRRESEIICSATENKGISG